MKEINSQRQARMPRGYRSGSARGTVDTTEYPTAPQFVWIDPGDLEPKAVKIKNASTVAVTAQFQKRLTAEADEGSYIVTIEDLTQLEVPANDEILVNFSQLFGQLEIYLKASATATVSVYVGGRERA